MSVSKKFSPFSPAIGPAIGNIYIYECCLVLLYRILILFGIYVQSGKNCQFVFLSFIITWGKLKFLCVKKYVIFWGRELLDRDEKLLNTSLFFQTFPVPSFLFLPFPFLQYLLFFFLFLLFLLFSILPFPFSSLTLNL